MRYIYSKTYLNSKARSRGLSLATVGQKLGGGEQIVKIWYTVISINGTQQDQDYFENWDCLEKLIIKNKIKHWKNTIGILVKESVDIIHIPWIQGALSRFKLKFAWNSKNFQAHCTL